MKLEDLIELLKRRDWEEMEGYLSSSINFELKILISAVYSAYHQSEKEINKYGLKLWNDLMCNRALNVYAASIMTGVDLNHFLIAAVLARNYLDDKVKDAIVNFVYTHDWKLSLQLESTALPEANRQAIKDIFPKLSFNKLRIEQKHQQIFDKEAKNKVAYLQASDQVDELFAIIFNLEEHEFKVSYSMPSSFLNVKTRESEEVSIFIEEYLCNDFVRQLVACLNKINIPAHYYNFPNSFGMQRGIQIFASPEKIKESLTDFKTYCEHPEGNPQLTEAIAMVKELHELKSRKTDYNYHWGM